jgi:hypothetical protein
MKRIFPVALDCPVGIAQLALSLVWVGKKLSLLKKWQGKLG